MAPPASTSEETLVAPSTLTYTFTNDNPSHTKLVDLSSENSKAAYTVSTEFPDSKTFTHVRNAEDELLASLEWRDSLPDRVTISGKPAVSFNSWLKSGFLPLSPVSFHDDEGRKYQWKNVAAGLNMQLYAHDTPGSPIASFSKSRTNPLHNTVTPARLTLTPRAQEIADLCVISFLFLEKRRRMRENTSQNRADMMGSPFCPTRVFVYKGGL